VTDRKEFSDDLDAWLSSDAPKTLEDLGEAFAEKSFAVTILLLMFIPALPLPTGGIAHMFEVITVVVSLQPWVLQAVLDESLERQVKRIRMFMTQPRM